MSRFREPGNLSNEGSTLVEVLGRYLERRRRDRPAKGQRSADHGRPRKVAATGPDGPLRPKGCE